MKKLSFQEERRYRLMVTWPNFFIVGAAKAGTTSLYAHLKQHPQVFLPEVKEPHFFAEFQPAPEMAHLAKYVVEPREYLRLYEGSARFPAVGDASPSYLWDRKAPQRIHQVCPQARIIILLRDPIMRAYSNYLMSVRADTESLPFAEALRADYSRKEKGWWQSHLYVEGGLYHDQVLRYLEMFGSEQVLVLLFDDLRSCPRELVARVAHHLGISQEPFDSIQLGTAHNVHKVPRYTTIHRIATSQVGRRLRNCILPASMHQRLRESSLLFNKKKPPINDEARWFLREIFAPEIARLETLLNRRLPELRRSWV